MSVFKEIETPRDALLLLVWWHCVVSVKVLYCFDSVYQGNFEIRQQEVGAPQQTQLHLCWQLLPITCITTWALHMSMEKLSFTKLTPGAKRLEDCGACGAGSHLLLQGAFLTQGWSLGLRHCRRSLALWATGKHVCSRRKASSGTWPFYMLNSVRRASCVGDCVNSFLRTRWSTGLTPALSKR